MDRLAPYISLGDMPDQEEDDSDQETVSIQDLPEEALVGLTTITLECYDRPFVLKLFNELAFTVGYFSIEKQNISSLSVTSESKMVFWTAISLLAFRSFKPSATVMRIG